MSLDREDKKVLIIIIVGYLLFCVALAVAISKISKAEGQEPDNTGTSYIAIKQKTWPCDKSLKAYDKATRVNLGFLIDDTFGDSMSCPNKFLDIKKDKVIRVHLANGTCFPERGRRCQKEEVFAGLTQKQAEIKVLAKDEALLNRFKKKLQQALEYQARNSVKNLSFYISPCMECGLSQKARQVLLDIVEAKFPKSNIVDNPYGNNNPPIKGYIPEVHGAGTYKTTPYIIDNDGVEFQKLTTLPRFYQTNKNAIQTLLWDLFMNCIDPHIQGFVEPRKRVCKSDTPSFSYLRELLAPEGMVKRPKIRFDARDTKGCKFLKNQFIWKQSDTHSGAVLLTRRNLSDMTYNREGKVVDKFVKTGQRDNKDNIYRTNKSVWELPQAGVVRTNAGCFKIQYPKFRIEKK